MEETGRALERGDLFGATGIVENNWGHGEEKTSWTIPQKPDCRLRHRRRRGLLFGGGIRER
jgi:hypothetical protein